jgi:PelA/Pel-15E family pectate lyase
MKHLQESRVLFGLFVTLFAATQTPTAFAEVRWGSDILRQDSDWYASAEARSAADTLLLYQSSLGAWPKNTDLFKSVPPDTLARIRAGSEANTIDNGATTTPMRFLARVIQATDETKYKESFARALDYLFNAQYPNGGWPQFFPLRKGYYSEITFNDGAMMNVMNLLRDAANGKAPYEFVDRDLRANAAAAVAKGIDCILRTQIREDGQLTVWCAQYDEKTLEPAWARAYEPPSLSGSESVGIVRFLMEIEQPTPEIIAAIDGAVAWFQSVAMKGVRLERFRAEDGRKDRRLVPDPAAPPLWARFYELETNRPLFLDRDSVFRYDFAEIGYERRNGYSYLGNWPASLLAKDYPAWCAKHNVAPVNADSVTKKKS